MKKTLFNRFSFFTVFIFTIFIIGISCDKDHGNDPKKPKCDDAKSTIANWPEVSKMVAQMIIDK
ncbi:MAG: hypothetical protein M3352_07385, partial [Bacteroidota bacterium]|nr:hypothetical protein [Bacteroidota bacterium]